MFLDLATSLVTPSRRLPPSHYITLQILAACPTALLYVHVCKDGEATSSGLQAVGLALIWVNFCIAANRVRDFGVSSAWLLPVYLLGTIIYLAELDPVMLGTDWATHELWSNRLDCAKKVFALLACTIAAFAMSTQPDAKRNRFGMPFGQVDWTVMSHEYSQYGDVASKFAGQGRTTRGSRRGPAVATPIQAVRASLSQGARVRSFWWRG